MPYASTFLSHSSSDKPLVDAVAHRLGRYGVIPWLDIRELRAGQALGKTLAKAISELTTVTVFLSEQSVISSWVEDELTLALEKLEDTGNDALIIPIFLDDPLAMVRANDQLSNRWLHRDGSRVDRLGIVPRGKTIADKADDIARQLARSIFSQMSFRTSREIIVVLDQRGDGERYGEPQLPGDTPEKAPVLTFRPDAGPRSQSEVLYDEDWNRTCSDIRFGLSEALGMTQTPEIKKIYLYGASQLGMAFLIGRHFNRNTSTELYCYNSRHRKTFTNKGQPRHTSLTDGDPHCETIHADIPPIAEGARLPAIALLLAMDYLTDVQDYLAAQKDSPPLVWIKNDVFEDNSDVMKYIADVVALLARMKNKHRVRKIFLYCGLPFHVVPLLSANLLNVMDNIVFMEYRRDLQNKDAKPEELYVPLLMAD